MPKLDVIDKSLPLGDQLRELIDAAPMMPLDTGTIDLPTVDRLRAWLKTDPKVTPACLAGLWLLAGDLDRLHQISQSIDTPEGSYWHGIMHRREGDYSNAQYWMRKVGRDHWVTSELMARQSDYGSPVAFIQQVQSAVAAGGPGLQEALRIQWLEWQLLFGHCWLDSD